MPEVAPVFLDAGVFVGALLRGDSRHFETRLLVEDARRGLINACTTAGVLSEVYAALTWEQAKPRHSPREAAAAVRLLVAPPSAIQVLSEGYETATKALQLAEKYGLRARRVHDARHAAAAICAGIRQVYSYDLEDWCCFDTEGLRVTQPPAARSRG